MLGEVRIMKELGVRIDEKATNSQKYDFKFWSLCMFYWCPTDTVNCWFFVKLFFLYFTLHTLLFLSLSLGPFPSAIHCLSLVCGCEITFVVVKIDFLLYEFLTGSFWLWNYDMFLLQQSRAGLYLSQEFMKRLKKRISIMSLESSVSLRTSIWIWIVVLDLSRWIEFSYSPHSMELLGHL